MSKSSVKPSKGNLLVSAPFLDDIFKRSVILLAEHDDEGSVGFILNKPSEFKLHEIIEDFPEFNAKVFLGGPVQQNTLNFIHKANDILEGGYEIADGIYWNGNYELLKLLIKSGNIEPDDFKFFIGYSGWNPDQLQREIQLKSWYVTNSTKENLFYQEPDKLWNRILKSMGNEYSVISTFPDDPSVN